MTAPPTKTIPGEAAQKRAAKNKAVGATLKQVLAVLQTDRQMRESVMLAFRCQGGDRDRWSAVDQLVMADVLARMEDRLELDRPRHPIRKALQKVRRLLESAAP